jgi:TM2 domain-containing membrane protein YozV
MSVSDDVELSRLSEEAGRLLAGLPDSNSPANSKPASEITNIHHIATEPYETDPDEPRHPDKIESNTKKLLFASAVSELRRRGTLRFEGSTPSLERSRETKISFVLCDSQNKVIGRVPLALLHSRIKQIPTESRDMQSSSPLASLTSAHQGSKISSTLLDDAALMLVDELTPQERTMFLLEYNSKKKSVTTGVILALFLGGLGVHKFWLGSFATGLIYLFFCWTFIPGIVAFIDACMMSFTVQQFNATVAKATYRKIMMMR